MHNLKVGDVVRLLSGGCKMTIYAINYGYVDVVYHDVTGRPHTVRYPNPQILRKVED